LIVKITKGLLAHKKKGKRYNTQECSSVIIALDKYFSVYEKDTPQFVSNLWYGEDYAGKQEWKGRSTETKIINVPMEKLVEGGDRPIIIQKEGPGRLYYRLALNYAPTNLKLDSASFGFFVSRSYEAVDNKEHVTQNQDGSWNFKLGQKVRVKIELITTSRRYHVALVDKLPAGLEIINPDLKGSSTVVEEKKNTKNSPYTWRWYHPTNWFEHQNLRDERAEAFQSLLWEGKYEYKYIARATTQGEFTVPPAKAEEMYSPEIFGRSSNDRVFII